MDKNFEFKILSVSQVTRHIKDLVESDIDLYNIWVSGEISNFRQAYSGHCYFRLKDNSSLMDCVMFRSRASRMNFEMKDGLKVIARGNITVYEKGGNYQLLVEELRPEGLGKLFLEFLQLKKKLEKKGYFEKSRKRSLPFLPKAVGIATSAQGAGLQDMIKTIQRKFPPINIIVAPTVVQGDTAPDSIVRSIQALNENPEVEVIIVGRGGGSFEDLNCFNSEKVANTVFKSKKPVVSGVGHETDFTICDMVADLRAETPTAASEAAVPDYYDLSATLKSFGLQLYRGLSRNLSEYQSRLKNTNPEKIARLIKRKLDRQRQELDWDWQKIEQPFFRKLERLESQLKSSGARLEALDPFGVLKRGYAIVTDMEGKPLSRAKELQPGKVVKLKFIDGVIRAEIEGPE